MAELTTATDSGALAESIERQIHLRTGKRVRCLRVATTDDQVIIDGLTVSYHVKQLALQGALEAMPGMGCKQLILNIQVC